MFTTGDLPDLSKSRLVRQSDGNRFLCVRVAGVLSTNCVSVLNFISVYHTCQCMNIEQ